MGTEQGMGNKNGGREHGKKQGVLMRKHFY